MSKTMNEMRREFEGDIQEMTLGDLEKIEKKIKHNTDGSKTSFYDVGDCLDVDDLCEHWNLSFAEGNCLKALVGIAKARSGEMRHQGTSDKRDAKKLVHYACRIERSCNE